MSFNNIQRRCKDGHKLHKLQEQINHLMYVENIKLFAKNEKELETITLEVRIYSQHIGMKFGVEKCIMLIMNSRQ